MSEAIRGIILAHSTVAKGLASAVQQISGEGADALATISNEGLGPEALAEAVTQSAGSAPVILFTDLDSGSCGFAARRIVMTRPDTGLVTGVNLAVLLDFVFHRDLDLVALVERLVEKGRRGITGTVAEISDAGRTTTG